MFRKKEFTKGSALLVASGIVSPVDKGEPLALALEGALVLPPLNVPLGHIDHLEFKLFEK